MSNLIAHALIKNSMDELLILKRTLKEKKTMRAASGIFPAAQLKS